jgi:hypothetical protein
VGLADQLGGVLAAKTPGWLTSVPNREVRMSKEQVQKVIDKALADASFRQKLFANPKEALNDYRDKLTAEEIAGLIALTPDVFEGIEASVEAASKPTPWYQPISFRETGGAVLSLVLIALMAVVLGYVVREIGSDPRGVKIGDAFQIVNTWERAKDLLSILFPLFGAVVTFWLGVAVEGRRADDNKQAADDAKQTVDTTQTKLQAVLAYSLPDVMDQVKEKYPGLF